jgi:CheY-like chemotaxis protein
MMIHRFFQSSSTSFAQTAGASAVFVITALKTKLQRPHFRGIARKIGGTALALAGDDSAMFSILFVSHDSDLRAVAARVLRKREWQVTTAAHGGHALLACVKGQTFDVLVVEEQMPEEAGPNLARRLRRHCPRMQVVCMGDHAAHRAGDAEDVTRVVRPFTADDLIEAVLQAAATAA